MRLWMRSAAVGAALVVFAGLLAYRSIARLEGPHAPDPEPRQLDPYTPNTVLVARIGAKSRITDELIAGRQALLEAAAAFRDVDTDGLPSSTVMLAYSQSASQDEAYCRSVISFVFQQAPPDRVQALTHDLEAELSARLRDGTLRLPEP